MLPACRAGCGPLQLLLPPSPLPGRPISGLQATLFKVTVPPLSFRPGKPASLHSRCSFLLPASPAGGRGRWPASQFAARVPDSEGNRRHYPAGLPPGPWDSQSAALSTPPACGRQPGRRLDEPSPEQVSCGGGWLHARPRAPGLIPDAPTREHGVRESPRASDSRRLRLGFRWSFSGLWPGNLQASVYPSVKWGQRWLSSM